MITKAKKRGININAILNAEMDPAIVKKCRLMMYGEFGHSGNIPHDLANTMANIYYEYFKIDKGLQKEGFPKDYFKSENIFDDSLLLTLYLLKDNENEFYGFVRIELNRMVNIEQTGKFVDTAAWEDVIPFKVDGDPTDEIYRLIDLQAKKFSAIWVITNTER